MPLRTKVLFFVFGGYPQAAFQEQLSSKTRYDESSVAAYEVY
jgi:predicted transcriptional regulator with HTH domain